jgi:hypothetical protein
VLQLHSCPSTLHSPPSTLHLNALNPQPSTLNPQPLRSASQLAKHRRSSDRGSCLQTQTCRGSLPLSLAHSLTPPLAPHPSPPTPHPSPLTPHPSPLTPHPSPLTPDDCAGPNEPWHCFGVGSACDGSCRKRARSHHRRTHLRQSSHPGFPAPDTFTNLCLRHLEAGAESRKPKAESLLLGVQTWVTWVPRVQNLYTHFGSLGTCSLCFSAHLYILYTKYVSMLTLLLWARACATACFRAHLRSVPAPPNSNPKPPTSHIRYSTPDTRHSTRTS